MKAIILAAGRSKRMRPLSDLPKSLLRVGGERIILRLLDSLNEAQIHDITVVTGYKAGEFHKRLGNKVAWHHHPEYLHTDTLGTLYSCRSQLDSDVLVLYADLILSPSDIRSLANATGDISVLVDTRERRENTMKVKLRNQGLVDLGHHITTEACDGNYVGAMKLTALGGKKMRSMIGKLFQDSQYSGARYTVCLNHLISLGIGIQPVYTTQRWVEIDVPADVTSAVNCLRNAVSRSPRG